MQFKRFIGKDRSSNPAAALIPLASGFWEDPETKQKTYNAESGDLICVSNFSSAALDIPVKSTQANAGLLFVAYTANIPKQGTPVRLVLQVLNPKAEKKDAAAGDSKADPAKPAETKPAETKPTEVKPTNDTPTSDKPADEKPTNDKPVDEKKSDARQL